MLPGPGWLQKITSCHYTTRECKVTPASQCPNLSSMRRAPSMDFCRYESTIPPSVTYGITNRMKDIGKVLSQLERLARKWGLENASTLAAKRGPHKPPVTCI